MSKLVIGVTGAFGSGCTTIINNFIVPLGFKFYSLSNTLKKFYKEEFGKDAETRKELQDYGNSLREKNGPEYLAKFVIDEIEKNEEDDRIVVDSFRNMGEVTAFREKYVNFYLIGIFSDYNQRWVRVREKYHDNIAEFDLDEKRDKGEEESSSGQQVTECFLNADLVICNNDVINKFVSKVIPYRLMKEKIEYYIRLLENPGTCEPNGDESIMAMAYAAGMRSSCIKRKVGAVIVDAFGNPFSSGFNEVPISEQPCEVKHGQCYRNTMKDDLYEELSKITTETGQLKIILKKNKILDRCRALHAEENAIINIARFGSASALLTATLFTTTYPCNLCANKIAQVGLRKIVYFEPYPVKEAKIILDNREIEQKSFEGVTYRSYFKLFRQRVD